MAMTAIQMALLFISLIFMFAELHCQDVFQDISCKMEGGMCKDVNQGCLGEFLWGKCPSQSNNVRCCVEKKMSKISSCDSGDKYTITTDMILRHEGLCQNSVDYSNANMYQGRIGYTCMGITPENGYRNRTRFPCCSAFNGHPADFVTWCFHKSVANFTEGVKNIYKLIYFPACDHLQQPAFYVCAEISVSLGPHVAREFLRKLGPAENNMKLYAKQLNQMHREYYKNPEVVNKGEWSNRADEGDRYIDSCL